MHLQVANKPDCLETKLLKPNQTIVKRRILFYIISITVNVFKQLL